MKNKRLLEILKMLPAQCLEWDIEFNDNDGFFIFSELRETENDRKNLIMTIDPIDKQALFEIFLRTYSEIGAIDSEFLEGDLFNQRNYQSLIAQIEAWYL